MSISPQVVSVPLPIDLRSLLSSSRLGKCHIWQDASSGHPSDLPTSVHVSSPQFSFAFSFPPRTSSESAMGPLPEGPPGLSRLPRDQTPDVARPHLQEAPLATPPESQRLVDPEGG